MRTIAWVLDLKLDTTDKLPPALGNYDTRESEALLEPTSYPGSFTAFPALAVGSAEKSLGTRSSWNLFDQVTKVTQRDLIS